MLIYSPKISKVIKIPFAFSSVAAGFPSPASDYLNDALDLNELLIKRPSSTFFVRATGNSMINAGIFEGDILVVDKSLEAKNGNIIIGVLAGEFTVKRYNINNGTITLISENEFYQNIYINEYSDFRVWGVVISIIRQL